MGETPDDETSMRTRAAELLRQLGENDHPDPSEGPSSQEIASTIGRTLQLPVVAQYRHVLQPEFGVFQLRAAERNETVGMAGIVDAIAYKLKGLRRSYSTGRAMHHGPRRASTTQLKFVSGLH